MNTCNKGSIVDVDCVYEEGKFIIGGTDACLPEIFTIRFRAPADYKAGDVMVFRKEELPVRTPGMVGATSDIFRAGAIVHADIDLVSRRAFVWMGGVGGALPDLSYQEQYAGFRDYDGKKVYVKMLDLGQFPAKNEIKNVSIGIPSFANLVNLIVRWKNSAGTQVINSMAGCQSTFNSTYFHIDSNQNLNIAAWGVDRTDCSGVAIIYYTCTDR